MKNILNLILLFPLICLAKVPQFEAPITLSANGTPITSMVASPSVVDWNNDGKKDLLLGIMGSEGGSSLAARVRVYLNTGSNDSPKFTSYSYIESAVWGNIEGTSW